MENKKVLNPLDALKIIVFVAVVFASGFIIGIKMAISKQHPNNVESYKQGYYDGHLSLIDLILEDNLTIQGFENIMKQDVNKFKNSIK